MSDVQVRRRLVKSTPELWAACSDPEILGRHLQGFGDLRVTRLEPETTVAWEGESVCGTVVLEPSGWGTQVTLTVTPPGAAPEPPVPLERPEPPEPPEPPATAARPDPPGPAVQSPAPERRGGIAGLLGLVVRTLRGTAHPTPSAAQTQFAPPAPQADPARSTPPTQSAPPVDPAPSSPLIHGVPPEAVSHGAVHRTRLTAALDSLGRAHHRPFSRS